MLFNFVAMYNKGFCRKPIPIAVWYIRYKQMLPTVHVKCLSLLEWIEIEKKFQRNQVKIGFYKIGLYKHPSIKTHLFETYHQCIYWLHNKHFYEEQNVVIVENTFLVVLKTYCIVMLFNRLTERKCHPMAAQTSWKSSK